MNPWKRLCCATDFSDASRLAMADAADLARCLGADLMLLHVWSPPRRAMVAADLLAPAAGEVQANTVRELEGIATEWKSEAERRSGRPVKSTLRTGSAAEEIVRFAREQSADVLVVATHGRTGLKRFLLGSVAEQVIRHAPCPVLVVRAPDLQAHARPSYSEALAKGLAVPP